MGLTICVPHINVMHTSTCLALGPAVEKILLESREREKKCLTEKKRVFALDDYTILFN